MLGEEEGHLLSQLALGHAWLFDWAPGRTPLMLLRDYVGLAGVCKTLFICFLRLDLELSGGTCSLGRIN